MNKAHIEINIEVLKNNIDKLFKYYKSYAKKIIDISDNNFGLGIFLASIYEELKVDYLFTTSLNEAIKIRKYSHNIPILVKENIMGENIYDAINNNITITIKDLNYLQNISTLELKDDLKIHLFIDNGSNIYGLKSYEELKKAIEIINNHKHLLLEGIYTNFTTYGIDDEYYYTAMNNFLNIIEPLNSKDLIIHANEPLMYHEKIDRINGIKFDLAVLGLTQNFNNINKMKMRKLMKKYFPMAINFANMDLDLVFSLIAYIKDISFVYKNSLVGRNYVAREDMRVGVVNIGYKDGITKALKVVVVNDGIRDIITDNIDEVIIKLNDNDELEDKVYLVSEYNNIDNCLINLKTNRYYLMSILNNNLTRVYKFSDEEREINYND